VQRHTHTKVSILTSGPYIEMLSEYLRPLKGPDGVYTFAYPLGDGALPLIHLADLGAYARWQFDNPERASGFDLEIATAHIGLAELAETFTKVTGKPARYRALTLEEFFESGRQGNGDQKVGGEGSADPDLITWKQNFSGFWSMWSNSGGNQGMIRRDYKLLDEILPGRVKGLEEWMRKVEYTGEPKPVLKSIADQIRAARAAGAKKASNHPLDHVPPSTVSDI
jgi:hypothetical protein